MPVTFLAMWFTGLLSLAVLGGGVYLVHGWYVGEMVATAWLVVGVGLLRGRSPGAGWCCSPGAGDRTNPDRSGGAASVGSPVPPAPVCMSRSTVRTGMARSC